MAYFYRLIASCCLLFFHFSVFAFPPQMTYIYSALSIAGEADTQGSSASEACSKKIGAYSSLGNPSASMSSAVAVGEDVCKVTFVMTDSGTSFEMLGAIAKYNGSLSCPANSSLVGSDCVCDATATETSPGVCTAPPSCIHGTSLVNGSCVCDPPTIANPKGSGCVSVDLQTCWSTAVVENSTMGSGPDDVRLQGSVSSGSNVCLPTAGMSSSSLGCTARFQKDATFTNPDGSQVTDGRAIRIGGMEDASVCSLVGVPGNNDLPLPSPAPDKCPIGTQTGQVNGVDVCMPFGPDVKKETSTQEKKDGVNSSGEPESSVKDKKISCLNGVCETTTTTVTTTIHNGVSVTTTTTDVSSEAKSDFCTKNPKSTQCGQVGDGGSSFGGSCSGGFTCDGDALLCAMSKEQHKRNCELFVNKSAESDLYDTAKALDKTKSVTGDLTTDVTLSSTSFDMTNILGSGTCMGDKQVVIMSRSYTLPFSKVCPYLEYLGYILMMVSFVLAARIVARG